MTRNPREESGAPIALCEPGRKRGRIIARPNGGTKISRQLGGGVEKKGRGKAGESRGWGGGLWGGGGTYHSNESYKLGGKSLNQKEQVRNPEERRGTKS